MIYIKAAMNIYQNDAVTEEKKCILCDNALGIAHMDWNRIIYGEKERKDRERGEWFRNSIFDGNILHFTCSYIYYFPNSFTDLQIYRQSKCVLKCRLQNFGRVVAASMC